MGETDLRQQLPSGLLTALQAAFEQDKTNEYPGACAAIALHVVEPFLAAARQETAEAALALFDEWNTDRNSWARAKVDGLCAALARETTANDLGGAADD